MKKNIPEKEGLRKLPHFPTVVVGTGRSDDTNLITVALVHVFSFEPPYIGIGIAPSRHSFSLLRDNPEFTVNVPYSEDMDAVMGCGTVSGSDVNKFDEFDLTPQESTKISTSGIQEFPITMECRVEKEIPVGDHVWFIGKVLSCSVPQSGVDRSDLVLYWAGEFRRPGEVLKTRS
ncbi:MAG: flavin reductase family protein [Thermoplasmata archaeon]